MTGAWKRLVTSRAHWKYTTFLQNLKYVLSGYILLHFSDDMSTKGYKLYNFFLHCRCGFIKQHSEKTCRDDIALLVACFTAVKTIVLTKANTVKMHLLKQPWHFSFLIQDYKLFCGVSWFIFHRTCIYVLYQVSYWASLPCQKNHTYTMHWLGKVFLGHHKVLFY